LIDRILEANQERYGLIIAGNGFKRSFGNFTANALWDIFFTALFGDRYEAESRLNKSFAVCAIIVDSREDRIHAFKKSSRPTGNPVSETVVASQIKNLFRNYLRGNR